MAKLNGTEQSLSNCLLAVGIESSNVEQALDILQTQDY